MTDSGQKQDNPFPGAGQSRHYWCLSLGLLLALMLFVSFVTLQRPRANMPIIDLIPDLNNAYDLVYNQEIPLRGCVSSYGGSNPPGVTLGFLPGVAIFPEDPFMAEKTGSLILLCLTLLGFVFLLARFGSPWLFFATALCFIFSTDGIFYTESLWPRAHPVFLVWFTYFLVEWVASANPGALGKALLVWILGMFWFMEIAPLVAVIPIVYLIFRPRISWSYSLICILAGTIVWTPFIIYQIHREGFDLKRNILQRERLEERRSLFEDQLSNKDLEPVAKRPPEWFREEYPEQIKQSADSGVAPVKKGRFLEHPEFGKIWVRLQEEEGFGGSGHYMRLMDQGNLWVFQRKQDGVLLAKKEGKWSPIKIDHFLWSNEPISVFKPIKAFFRVTLLRNFLNESFLPIFSLTVISLLISILAPFMSPLRKNAGGDNRARSAFVIAVSFLVPYVAISMLISPHEWYISARRYFWLFGGLLPAMFVGLWLVSRRSAWRVTGFSVASLLILLSCILKLEDTEQFTTALTPSESYPPQHECYDVMDYLSEEIKRTDIANPSIGYDISFPLWILANRYHYGEGYKIGWDFDTVLKYRYGISNANTLPEGIGREDDFRIVELKKWETPWDWPYYFDLSEYPEMQVLKIWDQYALLGRMKTPGQ